MMSTIRTAEIGLREVARHAEAAGPWPAPPRSIPEAQTVGGRWSSQSSPPANGPTWLRAPAAAGPVARGGARTRSWAWHAASNRRRRHGPWPVHHRRQSPRPLSHVWADMVGLSAPLDAELVGGELLDQGEGEHVTASPGTRRCRALSTPSGGARHAAGTAIPVCTTRPGC